MKVFYIIFFIGKKYEDKQICQIFIFENKQKRLFALDFERNNKVGEIVKHKSLIRHVYRKSLNRPVYRKTNNYGN